MPPVITITGLQLGYLLGGALLTEVVFAWPGLGSLLYDSITARDMPVVQATTLLIALSFVLANILVDLINAQPRSSAAGSMSTFRLPQAGPRQRSRRSSRRRSTIQIRRPLLALQSFVRDRAALLRRLCLLAAVLAVVLAPWIAHLRSVRGRQSARYKPTGNARPHPRHRSAGPGHAGTAAVGRPRVAACGRCADAVRRASIGLGLGCSLAMARGAVDQIVMRCLDVRVRLSHGAAGDRRCGIDDARAC